jgi:glycolate oxidase FAD binding subunit
MDSCRTRNWNGSEPDMDQQALLIEQVRSAAGSQQPLRIRGGATRSFYGRNTTGTPLDTGGHRGITSYTPSELVISARSGTPLAELQAALAQHRQMLAFEPPQFGTGSTLGGSIATGLSGPRRPWSGAARDFVLGVNCINGKGEYLRFGGQVMKNVAGYDLSRMLTGSLGTLAVLLEVHLRVSPAPQHEVTQYLDCSAADSIRHCAEWTVQGLPVTAACHLDGQLLLRLSGTDRGVAAAARRIGGETLDESNRFWEQLRDQQLSFFHTRQPLWRLSVPPAAPLLPLAGSWLLDWGGAQRWLTDTPSGADEVRQVAFQAGGHATLYRHGDRDGEVFQPLPPALLALHRRLKQAFDPSGILNPGHMYAGL